MWLFSDTKSLHATAWYPNPCQFRPYFTQTLDPAQRVKTRCDGKFQLRKGRRPLNLPLAHKDYCGMIAHMHTQRPARVNLPVTMINKAVQNFPVVYITFNRLCAPMLLQDLQQEGRNDRNSGKAAKCFPVTA